MALLHLHQDEVRGFARKRYFSISRVLKRIGDIFGMLHRGIVSAKLQRAQNEYLFRRDYDEMLPPEQDVTKFAQRPMILGDKWDF